MSVSSRSGYLETQVLTASPQRLRLMLIEGAIRFARQALDGWNTNQAESAFNSLSRCREILTELVAGVRPDGSDLTRRTTSLYVFLMQELTHAELRQEASRVAQLISVLEIERDTWHQLCEVLPESPVGEPTRQFHAPEVSATGMKAIPPSAAWRAPGRSFQTVPAVSNFSIDG